jgi:putative zinc finger protein
MMMHARIDNEDIVERYVRRQLPPDDEHAFDEHLLGCDECFEKVQALERFQSGMREAADRGLLDDEAGTTSSRGAWLPWAFALTTCTTVASTALAAWLYLDQLPQLRGERDQHAAELARERQSGIERAAPATLTQAEANVALVILQASRSRAQAAPVVLTSQSQHLVLWIDVAPSRYRTFHVDLKTPENRPVASVDGLQPNAYGALVASLPTDKLPAGTLRATLSGQDPLPAAVVGEYELSIERR